MIPPRREFLKSSAAVATAMLTSLPSLHATILDDQPIRIGFIGCGGMGTNHLKILSQRRDVQLTWVCDVDAERLAAAGKIVENGSGSRPRRPVIYVKSWLMRPLMRCSLRRPIIGTPPPQFWR